MNPVDPTWSRDEPSQLSSAESLAHDVWGG